MSEKSKKNSIYQIPKKLKHCSYHKQVKNKLADMQYKPLGKKEPCRAYYEQDPLHYLDGEKILPNN